MPGKVKREAVALVGLRDVWVKDRIDAFLLLLDRCYAGPRMTPGARRLIWSLRKARADFARDLELKCNR